MGNTATSKIISCPNCNAPKKPSLTLCEAHRDECGVRGCGAKKKDADDVFCPDHTFIVGNADVMCGKRSTFDVLFLNKYNIPLKPCCDLIDMKVCPGCNGHKLRTVVLCDGCRNSVYCIVRDCAEPKGENSMVFCKNHFAISKKMTSIDAQIRILSKNFDPIKFEEANDSDSD